MITVTFPDGSVRQFPNGTTEAEVLAAHAAASGPPPEERPSLLRQFGEQVASAVGTAVPNALSFLAPQLFDEYAKGMQEWYQPTPAQNPSLLERGLQVAGSAIGSLVPTVAAIPLGVPGAVAATFLPTAGQERLEALDQGASPLRAYAQGAISGGVEALSERFGGIGKITGPGRLATLTAKDIVKEPVSEMLSQAGQDLSAAYLTGTDPSRGLSSQFLERQAEAAFGGLVGAGVMGPVQGIARRQLRNQLTTQAEELQTQLAKDPGNATLIGQLAQTHAGLAQLVETTPSAPATPEERLNIVRKVGFKDDEVQFSDAPKWDFTPLTETDKGLLTGYGIEVGRDGTKALLSAVPAPEVLPKLQQALVLAGFTSADKGVSLEGVQPVRTVAEADLSTGKVTLHGVNLPPAKLEQELREERVHMLINRTELGQRLFEEFTRDRALTPKELKDLSLYEQRQGESGDQYNRRLADEFIAKLDRDTGWWRPRVQTFVARVKELLGMQLTNQQAGRILLRNLKRGTGTGTGAVGVRESVAPISLEESSGDGGVRRFKIRRGATTVGSARVLGDTLGDIEVFSKFQKQGIGAAAVRKLQADAGVRNAIAGSDAGSALLRKIGWVRGEGNRFAAPDARQSKVTAAALRLPDGTVLTGRVHAQIYDRVPVNVEAEDGFVDDQGKFLTREEAFALAKNQVDPAKLQQAFGSLPVGDRLEAESFQRARTDVLRESRREETPEEAQKAISAGYTEKVYHGSDAFRAVFDGGAFFTDSKRDASAYAELRAVKKAVDENDDLAEIVGEILAEEGADEITDLGPKAIRDIAEANGIDLPDAEGFVYSGRIRTGKILDLTHLGSASVIRDLWDGLHSLGLVEERWLDLDLDARRELADSYGGKASYRLFEAEDVYAKAFRKGYDSVKFMDQSPDGKGVHVSWLVKDANQFKLTGEQLDDAGNVIPLSARFNSQSNDVRESKATEPDLKEILFKEFPNAKVTLADNVPGTVAVDDQGNITVDRNVSKRELRSQVLLGLAEAGILKLPADFIETEVGPLVLALDPTAGDVRAYLKTRVRPYVQRGIAQRLLDWFRVRFFPGQHNRALRAFYRILDTLIADPEIKVRYDSRDQLQAYLDIHGDELNDTEQAITRLKDQASNLDRLKYWRDRKDALVAQFTKLRDDVLARDAARQLPSIRSEDFLEEVGKGEDTGLLSQHAEMLSRFEAESLARKMELVDELRDRLRTFQDPLVAAGLAEQIASTQEQLERLQGVLSEADPAALRRAREYRFLASDDTQQAAKAARAALDEPTYLAQIVELHDQARSNTKVLEDGTVEQLRWDPTRVPESTRYSTKTDWLARRTMLRDTAEELEVTLGQKLRTKLAELRKKLTAKVQAAAEAEIASVDLLEAARGEIGRSGSIESVEQARRVQNVLQQSILFANRLAEIAPEIDVRALVAGIGSAEDPEESRRATLAARLGFSPEITKEILDLLRTAPPFANAITKIRDAATDKNSKLAISIIDELEAATEGPLGEVRTEEEIAKARAEILAPALRRLRNMGKRLSREIAGIESELADLEVEYLRLQELQNLFPYPSSPLQTKILEGLRKGEDVTDLRNQRDAEDPQTGVSRMAFSTERHGWVFKGVLGQPDLEINPANLYTKAAMEKVIAWQTFAKSNLARVPEHVRRGLVIGIRKADNFLNEYRTTEQYLNQLRPHPLLDWLARSRLGFKQLYPMLLPGIWSTRLAQATQERSDAQNRRNGVEARFIQPLHRAHQRALDSLGLKATKLEDVQLFRRIRTELSARLRKHGSGVGVGDVLWSSKNHRVTLELIALIRLDHKLGQEAAIAEAARGDYAGIQLNYARTSPLTGKVIKQQIVRPRGETGDAGLARLADAELYRKLAAVKRTGNEAEIKAWWASEEAAGGLAAHFQDADRNDTLIKREPGVRKKEIELAQKINTGRDGYHPSQFRTVSDWVRAAGITEAELMAELDQYAAIAESRLGSDSTDTQAPSGSVRTFSSVDDKTEFTMPAAKMAFPSSWYSFGSSDGLKAFLNRTADATNVAFVQELKNAQEYLTQAAGRIERGAEEAIPDLQWVLGTKKTKFSDGERKRAARTLSIRAKFFDAQAALSSIVLPSDHNMFLRGLHRFGIAPILGTYTAWIQNIVGNGTSAYLTLFPVLGPIGAAIAVPFGMGAAVLHSGSEVLLDSMRTAFPKTTGRTEDAFYAQLNKILPDGVSPEDGVTAFLEAEGVGASYPRQFEAEREAVERGEVAGNRLGLGWDEGIRKLSAIQGTIRGDKQNNQFALRFLVPLMVLKFKAKAWSPRFANLSPEQREFLDTLGLGPAEQALEAIQTTPIFRPWRTEAGAAIARRAVADFNATTFANRPQVGPYGGLISWAAYTFLYGASTALRRTPNESVLKYLKPFLGLSVAALLTNLARLQGLETAKDSVRWAMEKLLSLLHDDRDDEDSWWEMLLATLGVYRALHAVASVNASAPTLKPTDPDYWERPALVVTTDLLSNIPKGMGYNDFALPVLQIGGAGIAGLVQTARGIADTGQTDVKAGIRKTLGVAGTYGRIFGEMLLPGGRAGFESRADIIWAAHQTGVRVEPYRGTAPFIPATPFRRELMAIGERLVAGDPTASADLESVKKAIETRAYNREIELGHSEADAKKAAEAAVKSAVVSMDPYRAALGRSLDPEELDKLRSKVGPSVGRAEQARDAVVNYLGLRPTRGMRSPLRRPRGGGSRLVVRRPLRAPARVRLR